MNLKELLRDIPYHYDHKEQLEHIEITNMTDDSRHVENGSLFVAIKGYDKDGHAFIDEAVKRGASAIIAEKPCTIDIPCVVVKNTKQAIGQLLSNFYHHPSLNKKVIGVTGTNGKTTTSYMIKAILEENGYSCGLIGTIEYIINGKKIKSKNTTPGAVQLQKLLYDSEDEFLIIEVSSHALKQGRVNGVLFDMCLFTNLDGEHLDYHNHMRDYFETKYLLFEKLKDDGTAIVNTDDAWGLELYERLKSKNVKVVSVGTAGDQDVRIINDGHQFKVKKGKSYNVELEMPGLHNKYNAALTFLVGQTLNLDVNNTLLALSRLKKIPGRFELSYFPGNIKVVVDYAHTPKGFFYCLNAIRNCGANKIIHVFGFRGNRDKLKRVNMMNHTINHADYYILTFDDLNGVAPIDMERELHHYHEMYKGTGEVITDRTIAIERAIQLAEEGDWIVITGKGHEEYKESFSLGTKSDLETVEKIYNYLQQKVK